MDTYTHTALEKPLLPFARLHVMRPKRNLGMSPLILATQDKSHLGTSQSQLPFVWLSAVCRHPATTITTTHPHIDLPSLICPCRSLSSNTRMQKAVPDAQSAPPVPLPPSLPPPHLPFLPHAPRCGQRPPHATCFSNRHAQLSGRSSASLLFLPLFAFLCQPSATGRKRWRPRGRGGNGGLA